MQKRNNIQECNVRLLNTLICEVLQSSEFWPGLAAARTSTKHDRAPTLKRMWLSAGQTKRDQRRQFKSGSYAELRVYFETSDHGFATDQHHWKTRESGLIAGDVKWLRDFKNILMMLVLVIRLSCQAKNCVIHRITCKEKIMCL